MPNLLSVPTAVVLGILYVRVSFVALLAYLAILPFQWLALRLYVERRRLYTQIVDGLVVATDMSRPRGRGHSHRVAELSVAIAREMRLSESTIEAIQFGALLHDVGMIGIDDTADTASGDWREPEDVGFHVRVGAAIAREMPRKDISEIILRHHERFDGSGHPDGIGGDSIPIGARVVGLAEIVDSMAVGMPPHGSASSPSEVLDYIERERGKTLDPSVADAFMRAVARKTAPTALEWPISVEVGGRPVAPGAPGK